METVKILIVEDESIIVEYIGIVLARHGYLVAGAVGSGEEAVAMALMLRPDLVLMDINIKGGFDGITAAARIKERADIPIVYLTAFGQQDVVARAAETKPSGYLVKPFKSANLIAAIRTALGEQQSEAAP